MFCRAITIRIPVHLVVRDDTLDDSLFVGVLGSVISNWFAEFFIFVAAETTKTDETNDRDVEG